MLNQNCLEKSRSIGAEIIASMDQNIKSEDDWSEELDHLPLKQRLKNLRARNQLEQRVTDLAVLVYLILRHCIVSNIVKYF